MKDAHRFFAVASVLALFVSATALSHAQSGGMDMKGTDVGKDAGKTSRAATHKGAGTVTKVDAAAGKVAIAHGPIRTLKWPAMTMNFVVKDKALLERLSPGRKIEFEFVQQGRDYVVTSAR